MTSEVEAAFFDRPVDIVARDLIGRELRVTDQDGSSVVGMIVESEAYGDASDLASHAAFRPGGRAALMAGPPGSVYVYSAYGMYPCFNIVAGPTGIAAAVLIRGVWLRGQNRPVFGPGRTTRGLGITGEDHGESVPSRRFGIGSERTVVDVETGPRVGISRAVETHWRFRARIESE